MNINDLEKITSRIELIIRDAYELSKSRNIVLAELSDFVDELQEEVDEMVAHYDRMADEHEYYNQFR